MDHNCLSGHPKNVRDAITVRPSCYLRLRICMSSVMADEFIMISCQWTSGGERILRLCNTSVDNVKLDIKKCFTCFWF